MISDGMQIIDRDPSTLQTVECLNYTHSRTNSPVVIISHTSQTKHCLSPSTNIKPHKQKERAVKKSPYFFQWHELESFKYNVICYMWDVCTFRCASQEASHIIGICVCETQVLIVTLNLDLQNVIRPSTSYVVPIYGVS